MSTSSSDNISIQIDEVKRVGRICSCYGKIRAVQGSAPEVPSV